MFPPASSPTFPHPARQILAPETPARQICKSCRRYWTKGGSLRNVPVGGGSRKSSSSSAAPKNPKRSKNSKRRRVAPAPEPAPSTDASTAIATDADAAPTEAATKGTADDPPAPPAAAGGFTDPSVALGLGLTDAGGKEPSDPSPFEWPSGCDLGSYWARGWMEQSFKLLSWLAIGSCDFSRGISSLLFF